MRAKPEGSTAAWLAGTLAVPNVQGHRAITPVVEAVYQSLFFKPLLAGNQKASLASISP